MSRIEKLILLVFAAAAAVCLSLLLSRAEDKPEIVVGEFVPPSFEASAVSGVPDIGTADGYGTLELSAGIAVSMYSSPTVTDGRALMCFASAAGNRGWVRLRIVDENGGILGETGLLKPGEYVEYVSLEKAPTSSVATVRILTYEPETYYSMGSANAEIHLQIN